MEQKRSSRSTINFKELLKDKDYTYTTNEKAPNWIYKVMEAKGVNILFCKKDRAKWQVVMDYDWFVDILIKGGKYVLIECPFCGGEISVNKSKKQF